jgi:hypothetical protein
LFTKVTRDPAEIVTVRGDTPFAVIVIVGVLGVGVGDGVVGVLPPELLLPPPPHAAAVMNAAAVAPRSVVLVIIRKTSWKY